MSREKTNSITHLVKIVAGEVFDEKIKELHFERPIVHKVVMAEDFISGIVSSLEKANSFWTKEEDALLSNEIDVAIAQIAKNHRRSFGAIRARIEKQIMER